MSEYKPLGSEKLQGDEKFKRILELTYYGENQKKSNTKNNAEYITESVNGVYGIIKEKDGYYVKRGLNENSLDYIGGLFMKNQNKFKSYADALKRLEFLKSNELNEATKYVLKQNKNKPVSSMSDTGTMGETPMPEALPAGETGNKNAMPELPSDTTGGDEMSDGLPTDDTTSGEPKPSDYMAEIQKYAGKLGQELRDQKLKMESDDIKYVLNMIISAVDLNKLEDEDIEEIGKKFDRDEENNAEELPGEEIPGEEPVSTEEPVGEEELGETINGLEEFINDTSTDYTEEDEIDLSKYADIGNNEKDDIKEIDLEEIKKEINNSVNATLGKYFNK